jgi:hypothetical protein
VIRKLLMTFLVSYRFSLFSECHFDERRRKT